MRIIVLSTFIENNLTEASFKIRFLTAQKMAEKGHDVIFISPASDSWRMVGKIIKTNFQAFATPGLFPKHLRSGGFSFLDALYKTKIILKSDVDVIQATNGHRPAQLIPCLIGKYVKKAIIVDECWEWLGKGGYADIRKGAIGKIVAFYDKLAELRFKNFYDTIITISKTLKRRFGNKNYITVIYGGTENTTLKDYDLKTVRKELRLDVDAVILGMSNVCPSDHNDNDIFFKAFEKISHEYKNLFLLLTGHEDYYIDDLRRRYSFSDRIISPGWVAFELYNKYLSACNLFILPYINAPINAARWPNKFGDYLCLNRPIVTNPTGDLKDFFEQYKIGLLCDQTPDGFYNVLKKLLDKEIDLTLYTKNSLYVANEILSFDKRIDKFLEIFEQALSLRLQNS